MPEVYPGQEVDFPIEIVIADHPGWTSHLVVHLSLLEEGTTDMDLLPGHLIVVLLKTCHQELVGRT